MIAIKELPSADIYPIRHPVLRPGKPFDSCKFDGDDLETTKHFGLFDGSQLAGVTSLFKNNSLLFNDSRQYQLRGMAVLDEFQGKGFGRDLVVYSEMYAKKQQAGIIWFNARIIAVPFYEKLGYQITGDAFDIAGIGQHYMMFKSLA